MRPGSSVLFLIDTPSCLSSPEILSFTLEELAFQARASKDSEGGFFGVAFGKQDLLVDGVDTRVVGLVESVSEVMETVYGGMTEGSRWGIYLNEEGGGISAMTGAGVSDGWLVREFLKGVKMVLKTQAAGSKPLATPPQNDPLDESKLRALIMVQNENDPHKNLAPADFFEKMESGMLEKWDHRAHLRAGYYVLLQNLWAGNGLWKASEDFLGRLGVMLASDSKLAEIEGREKRFRSTVHRTMTTFYLHMIHISLLDFTAQDPNLPKYTDFPKFLLSYPHLMNSQLWSAYYTKDTLFSSAAKSAWLLPDLKPLPTYIKSTVVTSEIKGNRATSSGISDTERLQRFAFTVLKRVKATNQRRGKVIKDSLSALQTYIIHQRSKGINLEAYSETKAYFWVQILHSSIDSLGGDRGIDITAFSFPSFRLLFPDLLRNRDKGREVWRSYYTGESWESIEARMGLVLPTLKPLPNVIVPPLEKEREIALKRELEVRTANREDILSDVEMMLYESWVICEIREASERGPPGTHAGFLWRVFSAIWDAKREKSNVGDASNRILTTDFTDEFGRKLGFTKKAFWVRVVLKRFLESEATATGAGDVQEGNLEGLCLADFQRFLAKNKDLALKDMWKGYYSEETWHSEDAATKFVPPDLEDLDVMREKLM